MDMVEKLIALRKEKGLTQAELAEALNVSRQAVSKWEVGLAQPSIENLKSLRRIYGVTVDYLFDDEAKPSERLPESDPEPNPVLEPEPSINHNGRNKCLILITIVISILVMALIYMAVLGKSNQGAIPIEQLEKGVVEPDRTLDFDLEW